MCGLVGIAGSLAYKDEATMKRLLLIDVLRGKDSTGLASFRTSGGVETAKLSSHPLDLFEFPRFRSVLSGANSKVLLGHNRSATFGAVSSYNAHPFTYGHITGAHNGTLEYECKKVLEDAVGENFGVDSMAIFAAIAKLGIEETISLIREGKDAQKGAWALTWFDTEENTMNFLRNKWRPLWYAYSDNFDRLFWASEWPMIQAAVGLGDDTKLFREDETNHRFWQFEENVHYKFDLLKMRTTMTRPKPVVKTIKGKEPKPVVATGGSDPFGRQGYMSSGGSGTTSTRTNHSTTTSHGTTTSTRRDTLTLIGKPETPYAGVFDEEAFAKLGKSCDFCHTPISYGQTGLMIYERDHRILCPKCSGHGDQASAPVTIYVNKLDQYL